MFLYIIESIIFVKEKCELKLYRKRMGDVRVKLKRFKYLSWCYLSHNLLKTFIFLLLIILISHPFHCVPNSMRFLFCHRLMSIREPFGVCKVSKLYELRFFLCLHMVWSVWLFFFPAWSVYKVRDATHWFILFADLNFC